MIDRESIKSKIRLAIQQLPSQGVVYREKLDDYNSKIGLEEITILEGLFYTAERASLKDLKLIEAGIQSTSQSWKLFTKIQFTLFYCGHKVVQNI